MREKSIEFILGLFVGAIALIIPLSLLIFGEPPERSSHLPFYTLCFAYLISPIFISCGVCLGGRLLKRDGKLKDILPSVYKFAIIMIPVFAILGIATIFLKESIYDIKGWSDYELFFDYGKLLSLIYAFIVGASLVIYAVKRYNCNQNRESAQNATG